MNTILLWKWILVLSTGIVSNAGTPAKPPVADKPTREQAMIALGDATEFFHNKVVSYGGYVWRYSSDLKHQQGEGLAYDKSNRPLYFTKNHPLTFKRDLQATHYQFVVNSRLDSIAMRYRILALGGHRTVFPKPTRSELAAEVVRIIATLDRRGAWPEMGWVRNKAGKKVSPDGGIIQSLTFAENVQTLSEFIQQTR